MISKGFYFSSKTEKNKGDRDFKCKDDNDKHLKKGEKMLGD